VWVGVWVGMQRVVCELRNQVGAPLRCDVRWMAAREPRPAVVVCHGFKGFRRWGFFPYAGERLAAAGWVSVCFDFAGAGVGPDSDVFDDLDAFARDTVSQQLGDLGCVLDGLVAGTLQGAPAVDAARLGVLGHSRGGAIAILRAHDDARVRAVATWAAISTYDRWTDAERAAWRAHGAMEFLNARTGQTMRVDAGFLDDLDAHREAFDVLRAASELRAPLLLVHGDADTSVPVGEARDLYAAAGPSRAALAIVPGAEHTFGAVHPWRGTTPHLEAALDRTLAWFDEHLGGRAA